MRLKYATLEPEHAKVVKSPFPTPFIVRVVVMRTELLNIKLVMRFEGQTPSTVPKLQIYGVVLLYLIQLMSPAFSPVTLQYNTTVDPR